MEKLTDKLMTFFSSTRSELFYPDKLLSLGFLGFVLLVAIVPASLWVPLKAIAVFLVFAFIFPVVAGHNRQNIACGLGFKLVLSYVLIVSGLSLYTIYSGSVEISSVFSAAARYLVIVLLVFVGFLILEWKLLSGSLILRTIFIGHFGYLVIKIGALIVARGMGLESEQITEAALVLAPGATVHGFQDNEGFVRVFIGNDSVIPFVFALYLASVHHGLIHRPAWGDIFIALNIIGAALTFTRFVWVAMILVMVVFIIAYTPRVTRYVIMRAVTVSILAFLVVGFILGVDVSGSEISSGSGAGSGGMLSERVGDGYSISEKRLQISLMWEAFSGSPVIGTGVGSHLKGHLRPDDLKFQYEVQWFALLMQLGVVGFLFIVLIATAPLWPMLKMRWQGLLNRDFLYIVTVYGLWLIGGFTNPYLFILNSVLVYLGFLVMSNAVESARSLGEYDVDKKEV